MPLAFVAASDEDADVAALWKDVWGEGSSSEAAALRLYISEILTLLLQGNFPRSALLLNGRESKREFVFGFIQQHALL